MEFNLEPGMVGEVTWPVTEDLTASSMKSGAAAVFATPAMIAAMECAALDAVAPRLPQGWITVGTQVNIQHLAPTSVGVDITARATLIGIDRRRLTFAVEVSDPYEVIGRGTHERFIVEMDRFMDKARNKNQRTDHP